MGGSGFLVEFVVALLLALLVWWVIKKMGAPQIFEVIAVVVFVLWLILALLRGPLLF